MPLAYLGLGSNLADPVRQVRLAFQHLARLPHTRLVSTSRLYLSPPLGPQDQPDYINAVALLETNLAPLELLDALLAIEQAFGRVRLRPWGERILDLDLLLYDDLVMTTPKLVLPHPGIPARAFVLRPLAELAPELIIPTLGALPELLQARAADPCEPLEDAA